MADVCRHCCGEVCSAISAEDVVVGVRVVAGAVVASAAEVLEAAVVVVSVEVSAAVVILAAAAQEEAGNTDFKIENGFSYPCHP